MPLGVQYWSDLQLVHGLRCYGNITRTRNVSPTSKNSEGLSPTISKSWRRQCTPQKCGNFITADKGQIPLRYPGRIPGRRPAASWSVAYYGLSSSLAAS